VFRLSAELSFLIVEVQNTVVDALFAEWTVRDGGALRSMLGFG
jgi:hypothetical protein